MLRGEQTWGGVADECGDGMTLWRLLRGRHEVPWGLEQSGGCRAGRSDPVSEDSLG